MANQHILFRLKISGPNGSQVVDLAEGSTSVGRQPGNQILLNDPLVSRQHARFDCTAEECQVTDLGSANGTTLNGERLVPNAAYPLLAGSRIKIGPFDLEVETEVRALPKSEPSLVDVIAAAEPEPPKTADLHPIVEAAPKAGVEPQPQPKPAEDSQAGGPEIKMRVENLPSDASAAQPPVIPPGPPGAGGEGGEEGGLPAIPGLADTSTRLVHYLPGIYQTDFIARFLGIFESVLLPLEWGVDNFDLFLSAKTAPSAFLPWLQSWYNIVFHPTWSDEKRRLLLCEAHEIFARRGTRRALARVLEIYTGELPEILDEGENIDPHTFIVRLPFKRGKYNQDVIQEMIDANKPAHTTYTIEYA